MPKRKFVRYQRKEPLKCGHKKMRLFERKNDLRYKIRSDFLINETINAATEENLEWVKNGTYKTPEEAVKIWAPVYLYHLQDQICKAKKVCFKCSFLTEIPTEENQKHIKTASKFCLIMSKREIK